VTFIMAEVVSKNGRKMSPVATRAVTPVKDATPKTVSLDAKQQVRRSENAEFLKNRNVKAFLDTLAQVEGGDYHAKFGYGWAPGWKTGKWTFSDESTHPGAGYGGSTTASGRYQVTKATWAELSVKAMGLSDFTPGTQDLIAVELLRNVNAIEPLISGDLKVAVGKASKKWEALPMGPGLANRPINGKPSGQPYTEYGEVEKIYKNFGGTVK
jgi:muramidase (phage lysozyme)